MKHKILFLAGAALLASGVIAFAAAPTAQMKAAVADTSRPSADTARDENRKPAEMLAFGGIAPGKVVVDLLPGGVTRPMSGLSGGVMVSCGDGMGGRWHGLASSATASRQRSLKRNMHGRCAGPLNPGYAIALPHVTRAV